MDLNNTEVLIDGTVYRLSSREDEAYLQKVAAYLNEKIGSIKKDRSYGHLSPDYQSLLIELNLADDYFKEQAHTAELEEERDSLEKDSYNLKHELVTLQMKLESLQNEKDALQAELDKEKTKKAAARKRTTKSDPAEEKEEPAKDSSEQTGLEDKKPSVTAAENARKYLYDQKQPQKNAPANKGGSGGTKH